MLAIPRRIRGISHPMIGEIFIKSNSNENILVIETQNDVLPFENKETVKNLFIENLLSDLKEVAAQVRKQGNQFDRVDIRHAAKFNNENFAIQ